MQFPKRLDRYIMKKFLVTFLVALLLIIGIVIIFDISEKIDGFVSKHAPIKAIIFDYYLNFIPYFVNMFSPLFVFITVIFFTSRLTANSEFVAILSCGVNFHRIMVPYLVSATVIAAASLALNLWVIPNANKTRLEFEQQYVKKKKQALNHDIHYKLEGETFVYVESFSPTTQTAYRFTLEDLSDYKMRSKLSAESASWDSLNQRWKLRGYTIREYGTGLTDKVRSGIEIDTVLSLTVDDFYINKRTVQVLPLKDLRRLIQVQTERGDKNVMFAEIELNERISMPFSAFILTILGVSLSTKKRRGGTGWNIALGIGISFTYILFQRFSQMFVFAGALPPAIAIWLPNIIFAVVAAIMYKIAPK